MCILQGLCEHRWNESRACIGCKSHVAPFPFDRALSSNRTGIQLCARVRLESHLCFNYNIEELMGVEVNCICSETINDMHAYASNRRIYLPMQYSNLYGMLLILIAVRRIWFRPSMCHSGLWVQIYSTIAYRLKAYI